MDLAIKNTTKMDMPQNSNKQTNFSNHLVTLKRLSQRVSIALDGDIIVSVFELQFRYCGHFRTITLGKGMNPFIPPNYWLNSTPTLPLQHGFGN